MFKNHLDIYLQNIPDEPTCAGMGRVAETNSLLHQVPIFERNFSLLTISELLESVGVSERIKFIIPRKYCVGDFWA